MREATRRPRRAVHHGLLGAALLGALVVAGCTSGAPPGFSGGRGGDRWTFPLVGPLEDGLLITPVMFGAQGPYLMAIDPDAQISSVDAEVVKTAELRPISGPPRLDESDTQRTRAYAEAIGMEIGTLIVERRELMVMPSHTYDTAGRRVYGVIGRDVLADSLVFGVDRDRGIALLVAQGAFRPAAGAIALAYSELQPRISNALVQPVPRRLVRAEINGEPFALHVDLGAVSSQLREGAWAKAKLTARDLPSAVIDEVGSVRPVSRITEPARVTAGDAAGTAAFVPYDDRRWEAQDIAGTLGLGFFTGYSVWASWHQKSLFLVARKPLAADAEAAARIGRWDLPVLSKCKSPGCIALRLVDPLAGKPPPEGKPRPGVVLSITRDEQAGGLDLEIVLAAPGEPKLPSLIVNLPAHVDRVIHQLKPEFLGKPLAVVDASPYPRACPGGGACVDQIAR